MEHYEMVLKLSERANVSFADAKEALEQCGWDMLDAIILLEKQGKTAARSAEHSTKDGGSAQMVSTQENAPKEETRQKEDAGRENTVGVMEKLRELARRLGRFLCDNRLIMDDKQGKQLFSVPVWIPAVLMLPWFWAVLIVFIVCLLLGFRFRFSGPQLGKKSVNDVMDKMGSTADHIRGEFSGKDDDGENR